MSNAKGSRARLSDPDFRDLGEQTRSFESLAQVGDAGVVSVVAGSDTVRAHAAVVSRDFFRVLGVRPLRGRFFAPDEQREGGGLAVVVSTGFWKSVLGGAPIGSGLALTFGDRVYTVVGVAPSTLGLPAGTDIWAPLESYGFNPSRTSHNYDAVGRLASGVSLARAGRRQRRRAASPPAVRRPDRHGQHGQHGQHGDRAAARADGGARAALRSILLSG